MTKSIEYAVRELIPNPDIAANGSRSARFIHQTTQARLSRKHLTFVAEAELSAEVETSCGLVTVTGRIDGYRKSQKGIILYEIKAVSSHAKRWVGDNSLKWARIQLQFYAAIAQRADKNPWGSAPIQDAILLIAGADGSLAEERLDFAAGDTLLRKRLNVILLAANRFRHRQPLYESLQRFVGQDAAEDRPLQSAAFRELERLGDRDKVLLALPPGCGKTRIALRLGLLKAVTQNLPLYWITEKAAGRDEVLRELERYRAAGVSLRCVWKTSSTRLCGCGMDAARCEIRAATQNRLFFEGLPVLSARDEYTPDLIDAYSKSNDLCPHELARSLEPSADIIIADLNYLLEKSSLHRDSAVIILDEVQNIATRIIEYSQVTFSRDELRALHARLPRSARASLQCILHPAAWTDDDFDKIKDTWMRFSDSIPDDAQSNEGLTKLRRAARYWSRYPDHYRLIWCHSEHGTSLIGTLTDSAPVAETLLDQAVAAYALSGSLPASDDARRQLFPLYDQFMPLEIHPQRSPVVRIIPLLAFKHPIAAEDHTEAVETLVSIREKFPAAIAVFGQNRPSNELISWQLRVRGHTTWLDTDIGEDWSGVEYARPDFVFFALGGRLSESVNPPLDLFTAAAVLSPGHRMATVHDQLRFHSKREMEDYSDVDSENVSRITDSVSRIIQATGRLQRSPDSTKPVFLLNKNFALPGFLRQWPRFWFRQSANELLYSSLEDALNSVEEVTHAK